jgi:hypothetical protein
MRRNWPPLLTTLILACLLIAWLYRPAPRVIVREHDVFLFFDPTPSGVPMLLLQDDSKSPKWIDRA